MQHLFPGIGHIERLRLGNLPHRLIIEIGADAVHVNHVELYIPSRSPASALQFELPVLVIGQAQTELLVRKSSFPATVSALLQIGPQLQLVRPRTPALSREFDLWQSV